MTNRDPASEAQARAADPSGSVWLSANAGSGKTRVLTNRVARLLLDGVDARNILCLTYTIAAATEMQNRLFGLLGSWAMAEDAPLSESLRDLGADIAPGAETLDQARRLFANAIETPGGLKIQTIHSFCASLLRRFPLEAGISPQFRELDELPAKHLRQDVIEAISEGPQQEVIDDLAAFYAGGDLDDIAKNAIYNKDLFSPPPNLTSLSAALEIPLDETIESINAGLLQEGDRALLRRVAAVCQDGSKTDQNLAERLLGLGDGAPDSKAFETAVLTGSGTIPKVFPTKSTRKLLGEDESLYDAFVLRIFEARSRRLLVQVRNRSLVFARFADVFLTQYAQRKLARGLLDFDDQINLARSLLRDPAVAQWVLFRLDGGIDHILVDEAQDTSPAQWDVIEALAQEFTAGQGSRENVPRSLFVVGDKKQSIYSFQGADPAGFDRMCKEFGSRFRAAKHQFSEMELLHSFRSAPSILRAVDLSFGQSGLRENKMVHLPFKTEMPGRVDLWPPVPAPDAPEPAPWHRPMDVVHRNNENVVLAKHIASQIAEMLESGSIPEEIDQSGTFVHRKIRPGDFLILVRSRKPLFHEIIAECKARELPVAGADKLEVTKELAVRDVLALLSFLTTPEDDLSLAAALRSPLFGWSAQDLHSLAQPRGKGVYLWQALRNSDAHPETLRVLNDLRKEADFLRPRDLIERVLTHHDGRRRLIARLGREVEDGLDVLLSQAEAQEAESVPSLTGFLSWIENGDVEVKRQADSAGDRIRIMTVHGAKGLESPIVILPDCGNRNNDVQNTIMNMRGVPIWRPSSNEAPEAVGTLQSAAATRQLEERDRLLYVAMTRAEKWLIVAAAGKTNEKTVSWHTQVSEGLTHAGACEHPFPSGTGLRLEGGDWSKPDTMRHPPTRHDAAAPTAVVLPTWADLPVENPPETRKTRAPSDLGGAKTLPGAEGEESGVALLYGTMVHHLLEHLPTGEISKNAAYSALNGRFDASDDMRDAVVEEALFTLNSPLTDTIFAEESLAEVTLSAEAPDGTRIHGAIDRVVVKNGDVFAVDFKTNRSIPNCPEEVPEGILRQMGAYAVALENLFPDHTIRTAILWTKTTSLMALPHDLVTTAFGRAGMP